MRLYFSLVGAWRITNIRPSNRTARNSGGSRGESHYVGATRGGRGSARARTTDRKRGGAGRRGIRYSRTTLSSYTATAGPEGASR